MSLFRSNRQLIQYLDSDLSSGPNFQIRAELALSEAPTDPNSVPLVTLGFID